MRNSRDFGQKPKCGALSARWPVWQSRALVLAACFAAPALAAPGGGIGTLPIGHYVCELPGDATGPAGRHQPQEDFTVVNASSYRAGGSMGSYLLAGDRLTMTSGPHRGKRYHRVRDGFVRMIDAEGQDGDLRCVKRKRNNA